MLYSRDKFKFVSNYIKSYENTIKILNKNGDFSEAKMFENFANKICEFMFNEKFIDLNTYKPNYPYVDLLAENSNLYVQVSTQNDVPAKVENTLKKISKSKKKEFKRIRRLVFFVLNNDSIKDVKSFMGKNKIGNISFNNKRDVISTATIIEKCKDSVFLDKVYGFVYSDFISYFTSYEKYNDALDSSRSRIKLIKSSLGNDDDNFELNREKLLNHIVTSNSKFSIVTGVAGCGKSSLCKKICLKTDSYIYLRAEAFNKNNSLNDIFGFSLNSTLDLLDDKLLIFVDSLEFISDVQEKQELLFELFDTVKRFDNVKLIASCRSSDLDSFSPVLNSFNPEFFEVPLVSEEDIKIIIERFPSLSGFYKKKNYKNVFLNLLYLDILIRNNHIFSPNLNEAAFRKEIFKNIICLGTRLKTLKLKENDVRETVLQIVIDRAKKFVVTVDRELYDDEIIKALISNNVLLEKDGYVRLRYDMFEDICFEHMMDKILVDVKNNLPSFFSKLEEMGRCTYRRFQIWLSLKMTNEDIGAKIAYSALINDDIKSDWKKHIIVGMCNSEHCSAFFDLFSPTLSEEMISKMIDAVNMHCHKAERVYKFSNKAYISTIPNGFGRGELIKLIYSKKLYKTFQTASLIKLCIDYTKGCIKTDDVSANTAAILEYYFDLLCHDEQTFIVNKEILGGIYSLSFYSKEWILNLWQRIETYYLDNNENRHLADEIFDFTITSPNYLKLRIIKDDFLNLVNIFWLNNPKETKEIRIYQIDYKRNAPIFINEHTDDYKMRKSNPLEKLFVYLLFCLDFKTGVDWMVDFFNKLILKSINEGCSFGKIRLINNREYYFNNEFAIYGFTDFNNCYFLDNIINSIAKALENSAISNEDIQYFKDKVLLLSNNGLLFELLTYLAVNVKSSRHEFFCPELCSSCEFLYADLIRYTKLNPTNSQRYFEKAIQKITGVPFSENRYKLNPFPSMKDYFLKFGFSNTSDSSEIYENTLKYLKRTYGNTWKDFVESMDINNYVEIEQNEAEQQPSNEIDKIIDIFKTNGPSIELYEQLISIYEKVDDNSKIILQEYYVVSLAGLLSLPNVEEKLKEDTCKNLLNFCETSLFETATYIGNGFILRVLFNQIKFLTNSNLINDIYDFAMKCIFYSGTPNGSLREIVHAIGVFINEFNDERIFNTIINLAIDRVNEQKWYYNQLIAKNLIDDSEFIPNISLQLSLNDDLIEENRLLKFESKKDSIIHDILHNGKLDWNYENNDSDLDLNTILNVFRLNISIRNPHMLFVFRKTTKYLIQTISDIGIYNYKIYQCDSYDLEDYTSNLSSLEFGDFKLGLDILIDCISECKYSDKIFNLFDNCFNCLASLYFDYFNKRELRNNLKNKINYLETILKKYVNENKIDESFFRVLILSPGHYVKWDAWDGCQTDYNDYSDKTFLIKLYEDYGYLDLNRFLKSIHMFKYEKLMPEIIKPMSKVLSLLDAKNQELLAGEISEHHHAFVQFISEAYCNNRAIIKKEDELCNSFEKILNILAAYNVVEAAVILVEFQML